ncbi:MAG: N-acetylmuramoyl-L-alanine amidase [Ignavibacteria bacterium]|nr:N-acetylmuramoyl-L-alanine amidase [Ignavibacteria bacterium]
MTEQRILITIKSSSTIDAFQKPERKGSTVIIRFPSSTFSKGLIDSSCTNGNLALNVEQIRTFTVLRITASSHLGDVSAVRSGQQEVVVTIASAGGSNEQSENNIPTPNSHWKLDVIVIDAGHGGVDAGAEGVNGIYEKNITLAIAKRLRTLVQDKYPDTKVVMTRETDTFVELYKRTQIANESKGKLFISIHCNSMPSKPHPARGTETYILRPGRNSDAASVAARENASIQFEKLIDRYASLNEDNLILATMAQRSFVRFSEELASNIQKCVSSRTQLKSRGVNQAGFFVLVGASMPNVLIETAFISNPEDAAYISSVNGQSETAQAVLEAINGYVRTYEKAIGQ